MLTWDIELSNTFEDLRKKDQYTNHLNVPNISKTLQSGPIHPNLTEDFGLQIYIEQKVLFCNADTFTFRFISQQHNLECK